MAYISGAAITLCLLDLGCEAYLCETKKRGKEDRTKCCCLLSVGPITYHLISQNASLVSRCCNNTKTPEDVTLRHVDLRN